MSLLSRALSKANWSWFFLCLLGPCFASLSGCAEPSPEEVAEVEALSQAYTVWQRVTDPRSLFRFAQTDKGGIRICLEGTGFTDANRTVYGDAAKAYVLAWIDAARPISTVPLIDASGITLSCSSPTVRIRWDAGTTGSATGEPGFVTLHGQGATVLLHELGHVVGLYDTYLGTVGTCSEAQPHSVMCDGTLVDSLRADDIAGAQHAYCLLYPAQCRSRVQNTTSFCAGAGQQLVVGDFNGDSRSDLVCHDPAAGTQQFSFATKAGTFGSATSTYNGGFCRGTTELHAGDFNGDGRTDLFCHVPATGNDQVSISSSFGFPSLLRSANLTSCGGAGRLLNSVGDFNGDQRADVLCRWSDSTYSIYNAGTDGSFMGISWVGTWTGLCPTTGRVVQGDFNLDGRDDLLCSDPTTQAFRIAYASSTGTFSSVSVNTTSNFCTSTGSTLAVGDFDGDGRKDLHCFNSQFGGNWIALSQSDGTFKGTSRYWPGFCTGTGNVLRLADFDANGASDVFCGQRSAGFSIDLQRTTSLTVSVGNGFGCALTPRASAKCWGHDEVGALGMPWNGRYTTLSSGADYTCGIAKVGGGVTCWGNIGAVGSTYGPPAASFTALESGYFHACGIKSDGSLACWVSRPTGGNAWGQAPASVAGPFTAVSAGGAHTCALKSGNAQCWGLNDRGAAPASRVGPFTAISAGSGFTCAIKGDKSIQCWGDNRLGQAPATVSGTFVDVAAGKGFACAQRTNGTVTCWGTNTLGQTSAPSHVFVAGSLESGAETVCAIRSVDNMLSCWGRNTYGEATPAL